MAAASPHRRAPGCCQPASQQQAGAVQPADSSLASSLPVACSKHSPLSTAPPERAKHTQVMAPAWASAGLVPLLSTAAWAAVSHDEIKSLPGWDGPLPTKHYSGYLDAAKGTKHMHYYLQLSEGNPVKDPITLWMNGGPGCTSLKGGFEELGQLVFNRHSFTENKTQAPKMYRNPQSWTKMSTMLYFESPPGVGFSYCDDCVGNSTCDCVATDVSTAEDNFDALVSFFEGFPEFKDNEFYITGESYAGQYIPTLMDQIRTKGANHRSDAPSINLKGAAVGNGVGGGPTARGGRVRSKFYYNKGMISQKLGETIIKECGPLEYQPELAGGWLNPSPACKAAQANISAEVGPHNLYNVDDFCPSMNPDLPGFELADWEAATFDGSQYTSADGSMPRMDKLMHERPTGGEPDDTAVPLGAYERGRGVDDAMMTWLMVPEVMKALHVRLDKKATEKNNLRYEGGSYPPYVPPAYAMHDYRKLYKGLAEQYRLWIYNGQDDGCIPYVGAQEWTSHLGFPEVQPWHPWFSSDQGGGLRVAAGYATAYGGSSVHANSSGMAFVTVKGAGHEVPTYKPAAAFTMFQAFLNGTFL